ncbi:MAG TPA: carboxymuconolactone decarboxylase family protein [Pseudoduganella sp.]
MFMQRLDYHAASPAAMQAMMGVEIAVERLGLEASLLYLVKLRCSQINGCAFCVDLHSGDALACGEASARLDAVAGWREADCFSARERAALAWTESLALLPASRAPDGDYVALAAEFSPCEQGALTLAISDAMAWTHFGVGFRTVPAH